MKPIPVKLHRQTPVMRTLYHHVDTEWTGGNLRRDPVTQSHQASKDGTLKF
jgi:hypothetical protein